MAAGFDQIYSLLLELWLLIKVAIIEPSCLPLIILVLVTAFGWYYRDEDGPLVRSQALLDFLYPILNVVFFGWFYATLI
ncbi:MAG: hypothetical protein KDD66_06425, partial [Bdellovibrionales bacterium]|nr:hypothetical protein [Bdellovibrionales bacterium]